MIKDALKTTEIHLLDKLEKLEIIRSSEDWVKIRKLRNKMAHEYPQEQEEIVKDIEEALKYFPYMSETFENIKKYLKKRGIL